MCNMQEINPVSKVRIIVDTMTTDVMLSKELLTILTHNLTGEQIDNLFAEINTRFKGGNIQFKLLFD